MANGVICSGEPYWELTNGKTSVSYIPLQLVLGYGSTGTFGWIHGTQNVIRKTDEAR